MTTLDYKNALQAGSPQDSALLGALFNLQAQIQGLPKDQQEFLRKALLPAMRSIRKASVVKKQETKSEEGQQKKPAPKEPETSSTVGGLIAKALKVAGVVIAAAIIVEVAEAAASALFTEFLLQLSEQGWKALPKEKVIEVVERELQKRVHVPPEQLKRIGEVVVHEFEHLGELGRSAARGAAP